MKIVLLSFNSELKILLRDDVIYYDNILKLMDNIYEIKPDIVVWDYESYPKHLKIFLNHYKGLFNQSPNLILLVENLPLLDFHVKIFFIYEKVAINDYIESFNREKIELYSKIKDHFSKENYLLEKDVTASFYYENEIEVFFGKILRVDNYFTIESQERLKDGKIKLIFLGDAKKEIVFGKVIISNFLNFLFLQ